MLPPVALRNHNQTCMFEKICVVTTFLDEAAEDGSAEQSTGQDAGAGQRLRTGSAEGIDGADGGGGSGGPNPKRSSLADGTGPVPPDGEAPPLSVVDRARSSQRRSSLGSGHHGTTSGVGVGETGSLTPGGTRGSLPLVAQSRSPSQPNSPGTIGRRHGQGRSKSSTIGSASWNQSWRGPGVEEIGSAERTKRIMQALCKQFYQGTPQVERHVFSGDERPCTPTTAAGAAGAAAGGPAAPSTSTAAAAAPSGTTGAEAPIGAEDVLDANPPTSARAMDGETE